MSHSVAVDVSTLSPEIITALLQAGALTQAQVDALAKANVITGVVGDAHKEVKVPVKPVPETYQSVNGFECKTLKGAAWASSWIIRHRRSECKCDPTAKPRPWTCKAVKKFGETEETRGSDLEMVMPDNLVV